MLLNYEPHKGKPKKASLRPSCFYACLGIINYRDEIRVIILDDYSHPIRAEIDNFGVIDNRIPEEWVVTYRENRTLTLGPKEFTDEFWMYFHDGDTLDPVRGYEAQELFKEVVNKIYAFHGLPPHFVEEKEPEPLKEHEWWKEYLDEDER